MNFLVDIIKKIWSRNNSTNPISISLSKCITIYSASVLQMMVQEKPEDLSVYFDGFLGAT